MASGQKKIKEIGRSQSMPSTNACREHKSATLPANIRAPVSSGEGFFTKLKRCLRIGSKGRYNVNAIQREALVDSVGIVSMSTMEVQPERPVSRATSLRLTRRSHADKEDVVLIRKGKMASGNGLFPNRGVDETIAEDSETVTVVHIVNGGTPSTIYENAGAAAASNESVEEIIEMDPGYETLEEIRRKVQLQALKQKKKEAVSKPNDLGDNPGPSSDPGQDSGITTPTTESPESGRDGQMTSITSSMFSESAFTEESNQVDTIEPDEITLRSGPIHRLNSVPGDSSRKPHREQRYKSDSVLSKQLQDDTDKDLYANPQILFRKQSQMGKNKSVSASTIALGNVQPVKDSLSLPSAGLGEKSVSEGDITPLRGSSVDSDTPAPPLPDRRYLDSDITYRDEDLSTDCSTSTTISANHGLSQSGTHDSVNSISSIREVVIEGSSNVHSDATLPSSSSNKDLNENVNNESSISEPSTPVATVSSNFVESSQQISPQIDLPSDIEKLSSIEQSSVHAASEENSISNCTDFTSSNSQQEHKSENSLNRSELNPVISEELQATAIGQTPEHDSCFSDMNNTKSNTEEAEEGAHNSLTDLETDGCDVLHSTTVSEATSTTVSEDTSTTVSEATSTTMSEGTSTLVSECTSTLVSEGTSTIVSDGTSTTVSEGTSTIVSDGTSTTVSDGTSTTVSEVETQGDTLCTDAAQSEENLKPLCDNENGSKTLCKGSMDTVETCVRSETNCSDSSDPSCAQDNVVVLKLHESTHEDSFTGEDDRETEGVSDATIARLEEKAAMLNMSKVTNTSKVKESCDQKEPTATNSHSSDTVEGAEALVKDTSCFSASDGEPGERSRNKKRKCKEEPIHMTLAEVMTSKPAAEEAWESDAEDEDYADVTRDQVPQGATAADEDESDAVAPSSQTGPTSAAAAHRAFLESMRQLKDCGWYWGPLSYNEAMSKLNNKPDGSFLVRDSSSENYILSLSFTCMGSVCHTRIEHNKGVFSFWSQPDSHGRATIKEFIEQAVRFSHTGKFLYFLRPSGPGSPPIAIRLLYPVSRFCRVQSLQHMCRFLILRWVRRDHIDVLPVPEKVKNYLRENQYYVETLEED